MDNAKSQYLRTLDLHWVMFEKLNGVWRQRDPSITQDKLLNKFLMYKGSEFRRIQKFKINNEETWLGL